jgi:adenosylmethionine-8-amino-7-oxononanoate aminotransferase
MIPYTFDFWEKLTYIQQEFEVLIIIDDIFMGGGKTGHYVGWKHLPIRPDIFTMGKAITGGFFPLSITLYNEKIKSTLPKDFKWEHGFTYNFSIPGIVSAIEYLDIIHNQNLVGQQPGLVNKARDIFLSSGYEIINEFGTFFVIKKFKFKTMYMIPLNADDMYFQVLRQDLNRR